MEVWWKLNIGIKRINNAVFSPKNIANGDNSDTVPEKTFNLDQHYNI